MWASILSKIAVALATKLVEFLATWFINSIDRKETENAVDEIFDDTERSNRENASRLNDLFTS